MLRTLAAAVLTAALIPVTAYGQAAAKPEVVIKVGTVAPDDTPWANSLKAFKKRVQKASNGRIKVKIFFGGILGGEKSLVRRCARGEIQMIGASSGAIGTMVPEIGVVELPYLFDSLEQADKALDGPFFEAAKGLLAAKGFVLAQWAENGYRNFATKGAAVMSPADLKGKKMRSQEQWIHTEWYRALGASPVQIPVPEVLPSLQTGVVDGYDNTLLYGFAVSWYSAADHITRSKHIYQPAALLFSKTWFDGILADLQTILLDNRAAETKAGRKGVRALTPLLLKTYAAAGKKIHELTPEQMGAFKALAPGVHTEFLKKVPTAKPLYDLIVGSK